MKIRDVLKPPPRILVGEKQNPYNGAEKYELLKSEVASTKLGKP